ncbi:MAG: penicillin-binding protein 2 [Anaerolineae bacterium]
MTPLDRQSQRRLALLFVAFGVIGVVLVARLVYWQLLPHDELQAADTANRLQAGQLDANRGRIFDRQGRLLAADVVDNVIAIDPRVVKDPADTAAKLSALLGRPQSELLPLVTPGGGRAYARLGRNFSDKTVEAVKAARIPGVTFEQESQRTYPMGSLAAHVLGFVTADGQPYYGVEEYYDGALRGEAGTLGGALLVDPRYFRAPRNGLDLVLTIDSRIQQIAERELQKTIEAQDAAGGTVIVMDPRTGALLALASIPTFDPNQYATTPNNRFADPATTQLYEPGSVVKTVTLAAALEEKVATLDTSYQDSGYIRVDGATIWDWDRIAHGRVDMRTMMRLSLNVGAVHLASMLGADRFYRHLRDFGFGEPTGVDLPGEAAGLIRDNTQARWTNLDLATNSFGQGMAATPIQVITAMAAVANGGKLLRPYVLKEIRRGDSVVKQTQPIVMRQVMSPSTLPPMREALIGVLEHATRAKVPGYTMAGKTGSSQIATDKGYDPDLTIASFVGFAPADAPQMIILCKVDKPMNHSLGSEVAAPLYGAIARQIVEYLDIPPDNIRQAAESRMPGRDDEAQP